MQTIYIIQVHKTNCWTRPLIPNVLTKNESYSYGWRRINHKGLNMHSSAKICPGWNEQTDQMRMNAGATIIMLLLRWETCSLLSCFNLVSRVHVNASCVMADNVFATAVLLGEGNTRHRWLSEGSGSRRIHVCNEIDTRKQYLNLEQYRSLLRQCSFQKQAVSVRFEQNLSDFKTCWFLSLPS